MSINPVQFQPGLSMAEFIRSYGTEARCYRALSKWRWPRKAFAAQPVPDVHGRGSSAV